MKLKWIVWVSAGSRPVTARRKLVLSGTATFGSVRIVRNPRSSAMPIADGFEVDSQAHWVIPAYIAAHGSPNTIRPSYEELGLASVIEACKRCSDFRGHGRLVSIPIVPLALSENPWREVFGLVGSIGESLVLAAGCEVEVELHRRARACGDLPGEMLLGQRFFSIAEGQEILGIGHRLANLVVRALAIGEGMRNRISSQGDGRFRAWARSHKPFSDHRDAWLSFNQSTVRGLASVVACSTHPSLRRLVDTLKNLQRSPEWRALEKSRGQDFHRWRAESSVLAGIDQQSGYVSEIHGPSGEVIGHDVNDQLARYTRADGLEEAEARVARSALLAIAEVTDRIVDALELASEPLSKGRLVFNSGKPSIRFGYRWDERDCSCCSQASLSQ